ncbi:hypothetical protein HDU96_004136, partial [Phlyctochytrium bullatum]
MTVGRTALAVIISAVTGADRDSATQQRKANAQRLAADSNRKMSVNEKSDSILSAGGTLDRQKIPERSALLDSQASAGVTFLPSTASTSFSVTLAVKDGLRALSTWETKYLIWTSSTKYLTLSDPKTNVGECFLLGMPGVQMTKSRGFTDCVDLRFGNRVRILQLPDENAVEALTGWFAQVQGTASAVHIGFNVSVRRVLDMTEWDINNDPAYKIPGVTFRLVWTDS